MERKDLHPAWIACGKLAIAAAGVVHSSVADLSQNIRILDSTLSQYNAEIIALAGCPDNKAGEE